MYKIYADGGCAPSNPGPGGFAFRIEGPDDQVLEGWGFEDASTNNRMEIMAATEAMRRVPPGSEVELICDSQYVLKGCSEWRKGWQSRGMKKADGEPVVNAELWPALWAEVDKRTVKYKWVRGHSGDPGNERADELVIYARSKRETVLPPVAASRPARQDTVPTSAGASVNSLAQSETLLMSLLSAKFGPMMRADAAPAYKETAGAIVQLFKRLKWTPPAV